MDLFNLLKKTYEDIFAKMTNSKPINIMMILSRNNSDYISSLLSSNCFSKYQRKIKQKIENQRRKIQLDTVSVIY